MKCHGMSITIPDRRFKCYDDECQHEFNNGKVCGLKLNEDTGECPKGHGSSLMLCYTKCCGNLVGGNHKFCIYHRKAKVKTICKIEEKIMAEFRKRMWGKDNQKYNMDSPQGRKDFECWKQKELQKTYDPLIVKHEKQKVKSVK